MIHLHVIILYYN